MTTSECLTKLQPQAIEFNFKLLDLGLVKGSNTDSGLGFNGLTNVDVARPALNRDFRMLNGDFRTPFPFYQSLPNPRLPIPWM